MHYNMTTLADKLRDYLLLQQQGVYFNQTLANMNSFQNPALLLKLVDTYQIDPYGSHLLFDQMDVTLDAYDQIAQEQRRRGSARTSHVERAGTGAARSRERSR
jgi:hypothetical protein